MKKLFKKKAVKGMTLVECVIALFVFGVMALLMVQICTTTAKLLMNSNHTNNKTAVEAPVAAVRDISADGLSGTGQPIEIKVQSQVPGSIDYTVNADKYNTKDLDALDGANADSQMAANIYFYDVHRTP